MNLHARRHALVAALVAASAVVRAPLVAAPPVSDEAAHLLGSWTLLDGGRLYVDFVDNKPPLLYAAYASAQALLGRGLGSVRLVAVLLVVPLTALAASAFFGHDRRGVLAALLYVLLRLLAPRGRPARSRRAPHAAAAAWAVVLAGNRDERGRGLWPDVLAGGLLGLAALVKPTAALWLAAVPLSLLVRDRGVGGLRAAARAGLGAAAGFALPLAATGLVFAHAGTLGHLVERSLVAAVRYVGAPLPPLEAAARAARGALPWLAATGAAWWAYARGRRLEGPSFRSAVVDALVVCSIPAVLVGGRFYGHYFLQLLFPLCLGAGPALARLDRAARLAGEPVSNLRCGDRGAGCAPRRAGPGSRPPAIAPTRGTVDRCGNRAPENPGARQQCGSCSVTNAIRSRPEGVALKESTTVSAGALMAAALAGLVLAASATAQEPAPASPPPASPEAEETGWEFGLSGALYVLPDEEDFVQPTLKVDRGLVHFETRYNYEDRESTSFFVGANFEFGDKVKLALTPMIGGLVGQTDGIIPALEADLAVGPFEAYGEAEYVFDLEDSDSKYLYMWSELSLWPTEWLRAGVVTQRTRVYQTDRDIQRGLLVGFVLKKLDGTVYFFNPGADDYLTVVSLGVSF